MDTRWRELRLTMSNEEDVWQSTKKEEGDNEAEQVLFIKQQAAQPIRGRSSGLY
jgi:hypothetical protein